MSKVIKASSSATVADAVPFRLEEMAGPGHGAHPRRQAADLMTQAQCEAQRIRQQAHDEGRAAGLADAEQILDERIGRRVATLLPALSGAIDQICDARAQWLAHWEKSAIHVASAIAGRIVRRQLAREPEITLQLVREALELAAGTAEIQLHVHPDDIRALGDELTKVVAEVTRLGHVQIVGDPQISLGGCRVETRFGSIDQQLEAQLARIEQELN
jgi:flagellar assembly protein FliH